MRRFPFSILGFHFFHECDFCVHILHYKMAFIETWLCRQQNWKNTHFFVCPGKYRMYLLSCRDRYRMVSKAEDKTIIQGCIKYQICTIKRMFLKQRSSFKLNTFFWFTCCNNVNLKIFQKILILTGRCILIIHRTLKLKSVTYTIKKCLLLYLIKISSIILPPDKCRRLC